MPQRCPLAHNLLPPRRGQKVAHNLLPPRRGQKVAHNLLPPIRGQKLARKGAKWGGCPPKRSPKGTSRAPALRGLIAHCALPPASRGALCNHIAEFSCHGQVPGGDAAPRAKGPGAHRRGNRRRSPHVVVVLRSKRGTTKGSSLLCPLAPCARGQSNLSTKGRWNKVEQRAIVPMPPRRTPREAGAHHPLAPGEAGRILP